MLSSWTNQGWVKLWSPWQPDVPVSECLRKGKQLNMAKPMNAFSMGELSFPKLR